MTDIRRRTRSPRAEPGAEAAQHGGAGEAGTPGQADGAIVRRTKDGWRVGGADLPDLTSAMVLADLLSADLASIVAWPGQGQVGLAEPVGGTNGSQPPERPGEDGDHVQGQPSNAAASETSRLRATIGQLEHALSARIRVEQAIGVLAERHRIQPRQAFEQLRSAARSRGRRVIDIAAEVVASATNPLLQLPDELSRPRSARQGRRPRGVLGSE